MNPKGKNDIGNEVENPLANPNESPNVIKKAPGNGKINLVLFKTLGGLSLFNWLRPLSADLPFSDV